MFIWISMHDILTVSEMREAIISDDMGAFYQFLHDVGFDINDEVEWQPCYHRRLNKEVVYGVRLFSRERTDSEWLNSGRASLEARKVAAGRADPSLLREMEKLCIESNFTGQLITHLESFWGAGGAGTSLIEISSL